MAEVEDPGRDNNVWPSLKDVERIGPALRVLVGLGDPERERTLLPFLGQDGGFVVDRCLSADDLLARLDEGSVDVALVGDDLHRLTDATLATLAQRRIPLVVLAARSDDERWRQVAATVLSSDAQAIAVRQAVLAASHHVGMEQNRRIDKDRDAGMAGTSVDPRTSEVTVIAVVSGHGSPGRTFVALNLAVALGAVAPTILVDADLAGPSVVAYLGLDPTRNLFMLAHADPRSPRDWDQAIAEEAQPLGRSSPHGVALCGIPKPEMRAGVTSRFFRLLLSELQRRYRYVVLDVGADLLGEDSLVHRLALATSDQILFVALPDIVGLWHARVGLGILSRSLNLEGDRIALVINRYDKRYHHGRNEIEWTLGRRTAAVLPDDPAHVQRAILDQRPAVADRRSPVGRRLLDLAGRIHQQRILLPVEVTPKRQASIFAKLLPFQSDAPTKSPSWTDSRTTTGERDGNSKVTVP